MLVLCCVDGMMTLSKLLNIYYHVWDKKKQQLLPIHKYTKKVNQWIQKCSELLGVKKVVLDIGACRCLYKRASVAHPVALDAAKETTFTSARLALKKAIKITAKDRAKNKKIERSLVSFLQFCVALCNKKISGKKRKSCDASEQRGAKRRKI
uniref:Uncharacterized protein n=1 Tax=Palpitomonas bilix TaxID=652834 RepID=A0A7S3D331_9EUKA|mmetsp:Transcript_19926/g.50901  ORF Transcript_19926/g.50901 Transcript_19926/m.50901 type:complete len:152 (+) Transcript_19926:706-1161(+)